MLKEGTRVRTEQGNIELARDVFSRKKDSTEENPTGLTKRLQNLKKHLEEEDNYAVIHLEPEQYEGLQEFIVHSDWESVVIV